MIKSILNYLNKNQFVAGIALVGFLLVLYNIKETILVLFVAYIIVAALNPAVVFLRRKGVPKSLAVLLTFFTTLTLFIVLIAPLVPFFVAQIQQLGRSFPYYLDQAGEAVGIRFELGELGRLIPPQEIGENAFALAGGVFGGFFTIISTVAISFYLLLSYESAKSGVSKWFSLKHQKRVEETIEMVNTKLGAWLQGQFLLSLIIGVMTYVSLSILQVPFALPLAVLAGLFEIIPTVGPIIASIPAIIVALTISPNMALIIIGLYIVLQLIENHLLVPRIMQRAVGLNPVIVIIGVIVGGKLLGVAGALLSVPFISLMVILAKNIDNYRQDSS